MLWAWAVGPGRRAELNCRHGAGDGGSPRFPRRTKASEAPETAQTRPPGAVAKGGGGQGPAGREGRRLLLTVCCAVGSMAGGAWEKEAEAPGSQGGAPSRPLDLVPPSRSTAVPRGQSLKASVSSLLASASDVPLTPEERSVHLCITF